MQGPALPDLERSNPSPAEGGKRGIDIALSRIGTGKYTPPGGDPSPPTRLYPTWPDYRRRWRLLPNHFVLTGNAPQVAQRAAKRVNLSMGACARYFKYS